MSEWNRNIKLANGATQPLAEVSACLGLLDALASDSATRPLVYDLRQLCFGLDLAPDRLESLRQNGLVDAAGAVAPVLRDVVFASVRGEGTGVHVASPFVDAWDRCLHELRFAQSRVRSRLPKDDAQRLITDEPLQQALDGLRDQPALWRDLVRRSDPSTNPPDFNG